MSRLRVTFILPFLALSHLVCISQGTGIDADWDVSPADRIDHYPPSHHNFNWYRFDDAPFIKRASSTRNPSIRLPLPPRTLMSDRNIEDLGPRRQRRDVDIEMEKIAGSKREARVMGSPESWLKQPLSVQFRPRANYEQLLPDNYEGNSENDEVANLPPPIRAHYAPKTDFVTSGRSRPGYGPPEGRTPYPEGRESRDLPSVARSYDEYDLPAFRNVVREHDFDIQLPRNYYYPNRYRSQRDYYYRNGGPSPPPYDRYRDEEEDYDMYSRYNRPTPKPKRIIYYATLPEVVRKPIDLRNYQRPYDPMVRGPEAQIEPERNRLLPNNVESTRRPMRYPYNNNYDNYVKRSSYYDRRRPPYAAEEDDRLREQERNRSSYREKMRSDDRNLDGQNTYPGDNRRLPWPRQIGTEVNVKENERIPGRKIFGQIDGYERYEGARMKKTTGTVERKEDPSENNNNDSNHNNDSNNNENQ